EKVKGKGLEDIVLDPTSTTLNGLLTLYTQIRRLALKKNFRALGYPMLSFPKNPEGAAQAIAKYAGFIILNEFSPDLVYPLLVLRENIYTDPQKPIQVQPGIYEINNPKADSPILVTTNFSITGEYESGFDTPKIDLMYGYPKDCRRGYQKIIFGIATKQHGVPQFLQTFSGNFTDLRDLGLTVVRLHFLAGPLVKNNQFIIRNENRF
ncbi:MAG: hypothetical protein MUF37_00645, partial [Methanoregulaceae archaeon]|nr:hypothetical protein [Methanoregulaceae archaeon]